MNSIKLFTKTYTYTQTRADVINDHFQMFLVCSKLPRSSVKKLLKAAENQELSAVGIYSVENGRRVAEVSFEVDWDKHKQMVSTHGACFDTNLAGWNQGIAPEAYMSVQTLVNDAKQRRLKVESWIRVSPAIRKDAARYKSVCKRLGYGGEVPDWKEKPVIQDRIIHYMEEAKITRRAVRKS